MHSLILTHNTLTPISARCNILPSSLLALVVLSNRPIQRLLRFCAAYIVFGNTCEFLHDFGSIEIARDVGCGSEAVDEPAMYKQSVPSASKFNGSRVGFRGKGGWDGVAFCRTLRGVTYQSMATTTAYMPVTSIPTEPPGSEAEKVSVYPDHRVSKASVCLWRALTDHDSQNQT